MAIFDLPCPLSSTSFGVTGRSSAIALRSRLSATWASTPAKAALASSSLTFSSIALTIAALTPGASA
ncbi:hypothetical protein G6321_00025240 [Bradyrhizobium barranii subsp. barranii]|uniref:Uncharacterized protein n=1 Tax=Bradyrhizobium barranii subsp. barranii TaxID=2823807 RepID=A0A7Z0QI64_9BRAD|nr:hypothetical protein [Bradyrhizobium barranii]UGX98251.1 hypothetical protein G6321_00025240 [Bradyrhizobium barranii subsp. barranii]